MLTLVNESPKDPQVVNGCLGRENHSLHVYSHWLDALAPVLNHASPIEA